MGVRFKGHTTVHVFRARCWVLSWKVSDLRAPRGRGQQHPGDPEPEIAHLVGVWGIGCRVQDSGFKV